MVNCSPSSVVLAGPREKGENGREIGTDQPEYNSRTQKFVNHPNAPAHVNESMDVEKAILKCYIIHIILVILAKARIHLKTMQRYNPKEIEPRWQDVWAKSGVYEAQDNSEKPKWYSLVEFPYPSGAGLHTGHIRSYTGMDVVSRKRRMQGFNVLYPMGWDAFGLPTENYAIKTGRPPQDVTNENIATFKRQLQSLGYSFDWSREVNTTDPSYYKWTQWLFLQFFKAGLAYKAETPINWCLSCKIGLANEEVVNGLCERCGGPVEKRNKSQWMLKITVYAEKLLAGLEDVDFLPDIKTAQQNWIGKSEGAEIVFPLLCHSERSEESIRIFTTRSDTILGATYVVLAPEHQLVAALKDKITNFEEVGKYVAKTRSKTDIERSALDKTKTGVELKGIKAINPANQKEIPVFIADYVLTGYGTGAIMAVPAHDERDSEFAKQFNLPIAQEPLADTDEVLKKVNGKKTTQYKLRDWVFSRQRYWGEPIPLVHCEKCGWVAVPDDQLPVKLPEVENYQPRDDGESPLASVLDWVNTTCPTCHGPANRETDVMPNWAGSSWYFLAYPFDKDTFTNSVSIENWKLEIGNLRALMPVDWYNGGMEHVTLHLLYSRFWNQFLFDQGLVPTKEPYKKRTKHGMILARDGKKMSKSLGNVVSPDDLISEFGADSLRLYEMFMGPFDQAIAWDERGILGPERFLKKVWDISTRTHFFIESTQKSVLQKLHETIKKVDEDIESLSFNTAISSMMEFVNMASGKVRQSDWLLFIQILAPFAPHITEEIYSHLTEPVIPGSDPESILYHSERSEESLHQEARLPTSIHAQPWPEFDPVQLEKDSFDLVIQVNGKLRATVPAKKGISQAQAEALARADQKTQKWLTSQPKKVIFIKDRLINFII